MGDAGHFSSFESEFDATDYPSAEDGYFTDSFIPIFVIKENIIF